MTITIRRVKEGEYQVVNGHMRLRMMLELSGVAPVTDIETGEVRQVELVDNEMRLVPTAAELQAAQTAQRAIVRAMGG